MKRFSIFSIKDHVVYGGHLKMSTSKHAELLQVPGDELNDRPFCKKLMDILLNDSFLSEKHDEGTKTKATDAILKSADFIIMKSM